MDGASGMPGMDGMDHGAMLGSWSAAYLGATFLMWSVMMALMMLPSAAPMVRLFAMSSRRAVQQGRVAVPTALFVLGYLLVWTLFSVGATALQALLRSLSLLSSEMSLLHPWMAAGVLLGAGLYQFTGLKTACLSHCRSPLEFLLTRWREGPRGAVEMGLRHGLYCLGCCWAMMLVLFAVGVMHLGWVIVLAMFVLLEKTAFRGPWLPRAALVGGAVFLFLR